MKTKGRLLSSRVLSALLTALAWLPLAWPVRSAMEWLPPNRYEFSLPRVCVPFSPGTDVVSLVPDLFSALSIALLCILLAEFAKFVNSMRQEPSAACYLSFVLYQVTLLVESMRLYAWDWYGYLLYFLRLIDLSHDSPRPDVIPLPSPWLSFLALLLCLALQMVATFTDKSPPPPAGTLPTSPSSPAPRSPAPAG